MASVSLAVPPAWPMRVSAARRVVGGNADQPAVAIDVRPHGNARRGGATRPVRSGRRRAPRARETVP